MRFVLWVRGSEGEIPTLERSPVDLSEARLFVSRGGIYTPLYFGYSLTFHHLAPLRSKLSQFPYLCWFVA